jgi:hypothetical protein
MSQHRVHGARCSVILHESDVECRYAAFLTDVSPTGFGCRPTGGSGANSLIRTTSVGSMGQFKPISKC